MADETSFEAQVDRIVYRTDDDWTVLRLVDDKGRRTSAVGHAPPLEQEDRVRVTGRWTDHPRFGRQLKLSSVQLIMPVTVDALRQYLASDRFRGLGRHLADRLVEHFGDELVRVLDEEPERLREVQGIGKKTAARIREAWQRDRQSHALYVDLAQWGISAAYGRRILEAWGPEAPALLRHDPYRLCEIHGFAFLRADKVARNMGVGPNDPRRVRAATLYVFERAAASQGHVYLTMEQIDEQARALRVEPEAVREMIERLVAEAYLVDAGQGRIYHRDLFDLEHDAAVHCLRLVDRRLPPLASDCPFEMELLSRDQRIEFGPEQRRAIELAARAPMMIITGGPGTGKTTITRAIVDLFEDSGLETLLCAPTGRAARRLGEATGKTAKTIHRLLEVDPATGEFGRGPDNPLKAGAVIADEASMIDLRLAAALFAALGDETRLVLIGDVAQLPPVGPGQVLADLIASGRVPVVRLERVYRQAAESRIIYNAHRLLRGQSLELVEDRESDFEFIRADHAEEACAEIETLFRAGLAERGFDPEDAQLLTPMRRGALGVDRLNEMLSAVLNPPRPGAREVVQGRRVFRVGDKVMQMRNNYRLDCFNGDIGRVTALGSPKEDWVVEVDYGDGPPRRYDKEALEDLAHAWATTIHKSQGQEFDVAVLTLTHDHYVMLRKRLLYTAITRGKRKVVVVGSRRALRLAASDQRREQRNSGLCDRLMRDAP